MSFHVLLVVHQFFPQFGYGTEKYTLDLAQALQTMGWRVTVLTALPAQTKKEEEGDSAYIKYKYDGVDIVALDLTNCKSYRFEQSYRRNSFNHIYRELIRELKPDIVHCCHLLNHTTGFLRVVKFFGIPIVYTLTDFWMLCWTGQLITNIEQRLCKGPEKNALNCMVDFYLHQETPSKSSFMNALLNKSKGTAWFERMLLLISYLPKKLRNQLIPGFTDIQLRNARIRTDLKCVDKFIVASNFMLESFAKAGYDKEQFAFIPFGVPQPTEDNTLQLKTRYIKDRDPESTLRIGFIGQVIRQKGVDLLVKAFKQIALKHCELHIYGDLSVHKEYAEELLELSAQDKRIMFKGTFRHDLVYKVLAEIDLLVIPSTWHENAPLVLLNGLSSKTPVVISDAKGMVEFVESSNSGYIFKMGDIDQLTACLQEIVSDREQFFKRARAHPGYPMAKESYAQKIAKLYLQQLSEDQTEEVSYQTQVSSAVI